ncbi:hypothetical protein [Acetomicrobium sp.]|uniref:hypothetical protein n=1 Tax=Acetomicrobium sp. TaxID=1872099 RepID=UPI001BD06D15|nr:hypothetical protein [Acetomicrobium sp.]
MNLEEKARRMQMLLSEISVPETCKDVKKAWIDLLDTLLNEIESLHIKIKNQDEKIEKLTSLCSEFDMDLNNLEEAVDALYEYFEEDADVEDVEPDYYESISCPGCEQVFMFNPMLLDEDEFLICPNCGLSIDPDGLNK